MDPHRCAPEPAWCKCIIKKDANFCFFLVGISRKSDLKFVFLLQLSAANLRWDVWEREKQRKKEAEELAWVLTHPVLRGPNGERVAGPAFEPPVPRPPRKH